MIPIIFIAVALLMVEWRHHLLADNMHRFSHEFPWLPQLWLPLLPQRVAAAHACRQGAGSRREQHLSSRPQRGQRALAAVDRRL
eukprot:scaffold2041_cov251-Pinguiococcus_pyrenoidosus.AAC.3